MLSGFVPAKAQGVEVEESLEYIIARQDKTTGGIKEDGQDTVSVITSSWSAIAIASAGFDPFTVGEPSLGNYIESTACHFTNVTDIEIPYLAAAANEVRVKFTGSTIESCALSNIKSGNCSEDCKFCSQSAHYKTDSPVYPQISVEEILTQAKAAEAMGATEFCMVSSCWGATNDGEFQVVLEAVRR